MMIIDDLRSLFRAQSAFRYATAKNIPGIEFAKFGRKIGLKLLLRGKRAGVGFFLNPVNIVRYFEFPFALSCLGKKDKKCLDVSSPMLFSFFAAAQKKDINCRMINPDSIDAFHTARIASELEMDNIEVECLDLHTALGRDEKYDCIWAISVIEHIHGKYDDKSAIKLMYDSLAIGGKLILTFPVDQKFWVEKREQSYYGSEKKEKDSLHFFQRFYDKPAIWERLLSPIKKEPTIIQWFGETTPGSFLEHQNRWMLEGSHFTVNDPREIADNYSRFSNWEEMPGVGVCGLMIEKTEN